MDRNLPATQTDTALTEHAEADEVPALDGPEPLPRQQPISVAFLPLALVTFILLAFIIAAWTFLAAGT